LTENKNHISSFVNRYLKNRGSRVQKVKIEKLIPKNDVEYRIKNRGRFIPSPL